MAGDKQDNVWPLPKFFFKVTLGDQGEIPFQEVTGLDSETQVIEYRAGNSKVFSTIKMPGIAKTGNITLKKGVFAKDNKFWTWYSTIKLNTIKRETVVISLMDEGGADTMVWTLTNAFPVKISGTDLKSDGNEVAVETIEIAYETIVIKNG
ncbi:phage tail protein [Spirosoma flavum]|uniref:Phage tail protein n=1 Tax=Spirosoma flavum TaxID=2048557 RepID=A0ABW6AL68_9BACT